MHSRVLTNRSLPPGKGLHRASLASTVPSADSKHYYPALDGLRAVAAILVYLQHYLLAGLAPPMRWGWVGVDLFFVLSGFLITGILFDTRNDSHRFRTFYIRRALRVFPLYYGLLLLVVLTTPIFLWKWCQGWLLYPLYFANYAPFLAGWLGCGGQFESHLVSSRFGVSLLFGHLWSLCVEEQFYLLWPCVVFFTRSRIHLLRVCTAIIVICPILRMLALRFLPQSLLSRHLLYYGTPFRVDALLMGAVVALMLRGPGGDRLTNLAPRILGASLTVLLIVWTTTVVIFHQSSSAFSDTPWIASIGFSLIDLIAVAILLLSLQPGTLCFRLFCYPPLRSLGQRSYGFYIFHYLLIEMYLTYLPSFLRIFTRHLFAGMLVVPFLITLGLSYLSYRYFETPFLRLKDRFTRERRTTSFSPPPTLAITKTC